MALAEYLGRVRGVVAEPEHVVITSGFTQGLGLVCQALAASGVRTIALDEPSNPDQRVIAVRAGLQPICSTSTMPACMSTSCNAPARRRHRCPRPPAPDRRPAQRRTAHGAHRLAAHPRRDRHRGRLRRPTATTAPPSAHCRVSNRTESSTPARPARRSPRRCASAGSSCHPCCPKQSETRSCSPTGERPASTSSPSRTSSLAVTSTGTCAACEPDIAAVDECSSTPSPRPSPTLSCTASLPGSMSPSSSTEPTTNAIRSEAKRRGVAFETMADYRPNLRYRSTNTVPRLRPDVRGHHPRRHPRARPRRPGHPTA